MSLGLLNPAGAFAFTALGVLVALYLLGRRRRVIPVPALFLWQRLAARSLEPRRFRLDPLFLAQLALLLALIGGYLRPYLEARAPAGERARILVVLDVSASMQAREPEGRRFDLARRRARALVAQCLPGDEVMLVAAAERPHVILRWTADHARARDRLEVLEPIDTPTDLGPALELALGEQRARAGTQVAVFTDLPPAASGVAPERLATVDYVQIGRTDDNVAIAGLTVEQPPFHPARDATATVLVRNYAHAARRVRLEARVGTTLWVRRELTIAPRGLEHVLLADPPGAGELVVTATAGDALPLDDRAFGYLAPGEPLDILLVTTSPELAEAFRALAAAVAGSRVQVADPARYAERPPDDARAIVFDGLVPDGTPPVPALYLAPPAANERCPVERTVEEAAVVDWEDGHPALWGLEALQTLVVPRARALATPGWAAVVVSAATEGAVFPFLVAGEYGGRRLACLGAELGSSLAPSDELPLLLLTLSTLRWLEEGPEDVPLVMQTGMAVLAGPEAMGAVEQAGLRVVGDPPVLVAERTGIYRVGKRVVMANLFDDRESDIGRSGGGEWAGAPRGEVEAVAKRELGWWLYLLGTALLVLEWGTWRRRERAGEDA